MAINKTALAALLAAQMGNSEINEEFITDEMLLGLEEIEEVEEVLEEEDEETDVEETEETEETDDETGGEEDVEEDPFDGIDVSKMTPTERMFYEYVLSEKKKSQAREISLLIQGSQISIQHKMVLDRMAKDGMSMKSIEKTIEDFKQIEASSARNAGRTKIVSKSKSKKTVQAKGKIPKPGTREFGEYLASLKK